MAACDEPYDPEPFGRELRAERLTAEGLSRAEIRRQKEMYFQHPRQLLGQSRMFFSGNIKKGGPHGKNAAQLKYIFDYFVDRFAAIFFR
jgi:hypothetical protein